MNWRTFFLSAIIFMIFLPGYTQWKLTGDSYNRLGFQGGVNFTQVKSDNFSFKPQLGYMGGLTTRANTSKNILIIYGVNFFQFNSEMQLLEESTGNPENIDFKATGVQLNLLIGHKIIGEHLSVEAGPVIQFNGKWSPEAGKENYRLQEYDLVASDIVDVSKFNVNVAAGLSAGIAGVKLWVQYQYGLTNMYRNLDIAELKNKDPRIISLRGRMGMAVAGIVVYI